MFAKVLTAAVRPGLAPVTPCDYLQGPGLAPVFETSQTSSNRPIEAFQNVSTKAAQSAHAVPVLPQALREPCVSPRADACVQGVRGGSFR
jgi:hypothetical protein